MKRVSMNPHKIINNSEYKEVFSSTNRDEVVANFANNYYRSLGKVFKDNGFINPMYANSVLQDINLNYSRPTMDKLKSWLNNPKEHAKELRDLSSVLGSMIMQYERAWRHFSTILNFNYELLPAQTLDKSDKKRVMKEYEKCLDWLRRFRPKTQFANVMTNIMQYGGAYYVVRNSDDYIDLQEMPRDYCWIRDFSSVGWMYDFDMSFFLRYPSAFENYPKEFYGWYADLSELFKDNFNKATNSGVYKPMPTELGVVFKFDDSNAEMTPPLIGVFKDALDIQDYKDLLKTKTELDTWQIIMQEVPKDKDGLPTIPAEVAATYVALVQSQLPKGVRTASTPMKPESVNFNQAQSQNNIIGTGEQNFWSSVGIAGNQFGADSKSGIALKYSNQADYQFVRGIYRQFERFINYQLSLITKIKFVVKIDGCSLFEEEERKDAITLANNGGGVSRLFASYGYEPFEIMPMLQMEDMLGIKDLMIPLQTSSTMSGKEDVGAPNKAEVDKSDSTKVVEDNQ